MEVQVQEGKLIQLTQEQMFLVAQIIGAIRLKSGFGVVREFSRIIQTMEEHGFRANLLGPVLIGGIYFTPLVIGNTGFVVSIRFVGAGLTTESAADAAKYQASKFLEKSARAAKAGGPLPISYHTSEKTDRPAPCSVVSVGSYNQDLVGYEFGFINSCEVARDHPLYLPREAMSETENIIGSISYLFNDLPIDSELPIVIVDCGCGIDASSIEGPYYVVSVSDAAYNGWKARHHYTVRTSLRDGADAYIQWLITMIMSKKLWMKQVWTLISMDKFRFNIAWLMRSSGYKIVVSARQLPPRPQAAPISRQQSVASLFQ